MPEPVSPEHGEVPDQGQEPALLERALDDGLEFRRTLRGDGGTVHGAPGHEALDTGRQRAQARLNPVRGHERGVGAEQGRNLVLVGLKLVERAFQGGVFVAGVLQLDHGQGQAVDEQHHIGPAVVLSLDHRELVHRQPVVGIGVGEIDQPGRIAADIAVLPGNLDGHALNQIAVQAAVLLDEREGLRLPHLAQHVLQRRGGQVRVEACERLAEPTGQQHLIVAAALRRRTFRTDVRSVRHGIAKPGEPFESGVLHLAFGESGHSAGTDSRFIMRRIIKSLPWGRALRDQQGERGERPGVEPVRHSLLCEIEQEQKSADALVAVGEGVILDDEIEQMGRLFLAAAVERFAEHGLLDIADNGL